MASNSANGVSNDTLPTLPPTPAGQVSKLGMAAYRAPSLFQPHRLREALSDAHAGRIPPLIGYFAGLSSVELPGVPGHEHARIGFALDAGASIIVPQVDTVEQARQIVSAAKYGGKINGRRSAPPERLVPGTSDICLDPSTTIYQNLNRQAAIIIQIESLEGIKNLDVILTAVGDQIDSVWLGSLDTRVSMEMTSGGVWGDEKEFLDAVALYESILRKHNKPASGLALGPQEMKKTMARSRSFIVTTSDMYSLLGAAMQDFGEVREGFPAMDYSDVYKAL